MVHPPPAPPPKEPGKSAKKELGKIKREAALRRIEDKIERFRAKANQKKKSTGSTEAGGGAALPGNITDQSRSSPANIYNLKGKEISREVSVKFSIYYARIWEQIQNAWFLPPSLANTSHNLEAIIAHEFNSYLCRIE